MWAKGFDWDRIGTDVAAIGSMIKALGLPKLSAFVLFQILGVSKIMFIAQLREPTQVFLDQMDRVSKLVLGGPWNWQATSMMHHLKESCFFPCSIKNIECLCKAIRIRTAIHTYPRWDESVKALVRICCRDEANIVPFYQEWMACSSFKVLG